MPSIEAVPAAVLVVELRLGHRVVDVDRRELERARLGHLVQPVHAGGGLLGHALDRLRRLRPLAGVVGEGVAQPVEDDPPLLGVVLVRRGNRAGRLVLRALVHEQRGVAAVVQDHVRSLAAGPGQRLLGAPPVLLERLALPGEDRDALRVVRGAVGADRDGRRGVVLGGEDVAARPADLRAEGRQGLDENRGLDGHVQRAGDPGALAAAGFPRTRRGSPSGRASRARRAVSPCDRSWPARCRPP